MKITQLTVENIKRVFAISLDLDSDGNMVVITGRNNQGKSSVLDAIWYAIGGAKDIPAQPLRTGAKKGRVHVEIDGGKIIVERKFSAKGGSSLVVTANGKIQKSPQALLSALLSPFAFDPMEFMRMSPRDQADVLRRMSGLDLDDLRAEYESTFSDRRDLKRDLQRHEAIIDGLPPEPQQVPTERVSVSELIAEREALRDKANAIRTANEYVKLADTEQQQCKQALIQAQADFDAADEALAKRAKALADLMQECGDVQPAIDAVTDRINSAESVNSLYDEAVKRAELIKERDNMAHEVMEHDNRLDALREKKAELIAAASLPVDGLSFDGEAVEYNGIPLDQASMSEQIKVSMAIVMAENPKLKVVRIADGSLLDSDSLAQVAAIAKANDYQVWVETVGDGDGSGFVIEDGSLRNGE